MSRSTIGRHLAVAAPVGAGLAIVIAMVGPFTDYELAGIGYFAIAAAGLTVLTGLNGQVSLGHGALMAVGAYTTALLARQSGTLAPVLVMAASVVAAMAVSAIVGVAAARLRGPYLAGATLALALALPGVAVRFSSVFGGDQGLSVPALDPPAFLGADTPPERWLAWVSLAAALLTFVLLANLTASRFGREMRAVRDGEIPAALAGVSIARTQVLAFVISGACAGLAGSLAAYWSSLAAPAGFGLSLSLSLLAAIVLGGLGRLAGAVWGAAALVYLPELSSNATDVLHLPSAVRDNLPLALYGAVFIVAILVFPAGIQGGISLLWRKYRPAGLPGPTANADGAG